MNANQVHQMELGFNGKIRRLARPQRRKRANWWFAQMRRVVEAAMEWRPAPDARPEQVYLEMAAKRS